MNYAWIENSKVMEVIPEFNPVFPDIPINQRYSANVAAHCIPVPEGAEVKAGYIYDPETGTFSPPPPAPVPPEPEPSPSGVTIDDLMEAIAELAEKQEADKLETQEAIAGLAESLS